MKNKKIVRFSGEAFQLWWTLWHNVSHIKKKHKEEMIFEVYQEMH